MACKEFLGAGKCFQMGWGAYDTLVGFTPQGIDVETFAEIEKAGDGTDTLQILICDPGTKLSGTWLVNCTDPVTDLAAPVVGDPIQIGAKWFMILNGSKISYNGKNLVLSLSLEAHDSIDYDPAP